MSKAHILTGNNAGGYNAAVHFTVPLGNNSAGVSWKQTMITDGQNISVLIVPAITQVELDSIIAGDTVEFVTVIDRYESGGGSDISVEEIVDLAILNKKKELQRRYKYYGKTI